MPAANVHGIFGLYMNLATIPALPDPSQGDLNFGTLFFGNPFPNTWNVVATAGIGYATLPLSLPGSPNVALFSQFMYVTDDLAPFTAAAAANGIVPQLSPPTTVTLNGISAFQDLSGVGTSPTLS